MTPQSEPKKQGFDDDFAIVAHPAGGVSLHHHVLRTDVAGMPLEWIDYREAARLYHQDQIAYTCGTPIFRLYGGINARTGLRNHARGEFDRRDGRTSR
jgi:hypothetical protein